MRVLILAVCAVMLLALPASALEIEAPPVPEAGAHWMPEETASFGQGVNALLGKAAAAVRPDLAEAAGTGIRIFCAVLLLSVLQSFSGAARGCAQVTGAVLIAGILLGSTQSMIHLGAQTVQQMSDYGKLLLPVMTASLAAQGGASASAVLYGGTALFDQLLSALISGVLVPMVYVFLALAAANCASGQDLLKKFRDLIKWGIGWSLKTLLSVYTAYMGISGVVSGTTDAAALKATKMTISTVVPVVGGILSDASEAVLVSAGLMKNAAGIYGIFAVLALFLGPFLKIAAHYLILKLTAALCALFGTKSTTDLIEDFSAAMGFLLAMTGASCLLVLISTVCFLKGVGH